MRRTPYSLVVGALVSLAAVADPAFAQAPSRSAQGRSPGSAPPRVEWQRLGDIMTALGAADGRRIADIGAGRGEFTRELAGRVGRSGRVVAVEISEKMVQALNDLVARDSLTNVDVVTGTESDPRLPAESLDAALILNTYHELTHHGEMLAAIRRALRPGGVLVIVDNAAVDTTLTRDVQVSRHGISSAFADAEVRAAGFEVVERADTFITQPYPVFLLVARRK